MKQCKKCKLSKSLDLFSKNTVWCKDCHKVYQKENRAKISKNHKIWVEANREKVQEVIKKAQWVLSSQG